MTTDTVAYFCPECGSPSVERSMLAGGFAACRACGWSGGTDKLAAMPLSHTLGSDADLLSSMVGDLRILLSKDVGVVLAQFLQKYGFISTVGSSREIAGKLLGRYLAVIARHIVTAIIEERDKMEVERAARS